MAKKRNSNANKQNNQSPNKNNKKTKKNKQKTKITNDTNKDNEVKEKIEIKLNTKKVIVDDDNSKNTATTATANAANNNKANSDKVKLLKTKDGKQKDKKINKNNNNDDIEMKDANDDDLSSATSSSTQSSTPPKKNNNKRKNEEVATKKLTTKKKQLLSSDDDDSDDDEKDNNMLLGSSDDEDNDEEMLLPIEKETNLLNEEKELEKIEAEEEYQHVIKTQTEEYDSTFILPKIEEIQEEIDGIRILSPKDYYQRIETVLQILSNFSLYNKNKQNTGSSSSRTDYMDQYQHDLMQYFGYIPDLISLFLTMLGPNETLEFLKASEKPRPIVLRTNTLKCRRKDLASALMKRGISLDPLASWSKVGLKVYDTGNVPIAATPEYLSGYYMLQGASSMCPVLALDAQVNDVVLDMCASPGGKTTYISQVLKNTGIVHANDVSRDRQKATIGNLHRLGCHNVVVFSMDGRKICKSKPNYYDRVLLDAPCSGLGVISRDPSVKLQRTISDIEKRAHLQKELLLSAIDATKINGTVVYSTCSIAVQENEGVVQYALMKRPNVKLVPIGLDFGKPGFTRFQTLRFHSSLELTRRFYPHVHNMDGFYVSKFVKTSAYTKPEKVVDDNDSDVKQDKGKVMKKDEDSISEEKKIRVPKK